MFNRQIINTNAPIIGDSEFHSVLSTITFNSIKIPIDVFYDNSKFETSTENPENTSRVEEEYSKVEERQNSKTPALKKGTSMFTRPKGAKNKQLLKDDPRYHATPEEPTTAAGRSRKIETRVTKRPVSSYGMIKDYNVNQNARVGSISSSRPKMYNQYKKSTHSFRDMGHSSNRYTPKSKDRRDGEVHSFIAADNSVSLMKQMDTNRAGGNSVSGDNQMVQVDEEEEKKLIQENPMRKRIFLHIAQTSTSVQVAWSHANKTKTGKRIQYVLEYGVGIKMNGEEQFRTIYKGKAHKCIITDLIPRTTYRFKVVPFRSNESGEDEFGECSDIKQINTFDYQDIHQSSLGHHASILMKKQEKWINFEKQGLITSQYGYSYGVQMWKITIN